MLQLNIFNMLQFELTTFQAISFVLQQRAMCFTMLLFKLWVLCCCISSYKFFIGPFQAIGFAFCVSLLHFELGITILLLFVLHMSCVTTIPKKIWNQSIKFSFLFHPFDQSYIFLWNCLWTLCATIALTTIVLNFVEVSNDKLFIFSSCDFACICVFGLAIRVGFLWFHVCVFSNL